MRTVCTIVCKIPQTNVVISLRDMSSKVTISAKIKYSTNATVIICGIDITDSYAKPHLASGYAKLLHICKFCNCVNICVKTFIINDK